MMGVVGTQTEALFSRTCLGCNRPKLPAEFLSRRGPVHQICSLCRSKAYKQRQRKSSKNYYRRKHPGFQQYLKRRAAMEFIRALAERRLQKGKEANWMPEEYAVRLTKLPERIATIVGKTYAERGDSCELADDEAVGMIRDLLLELDPAILERNKNKKLARIKASS